MSQLSLKEAAVVKAVLTDSRISITALAQKIGLSKSTIDRIIKTLKERGILRREGPKKNATWIVNNP